MSKNLIQGIKNYLANTHRFFNYGSPNVNVLSNLYNATPVEVMTLQNGNVGIGTNVPISKLDVRGNIVCSNISVIGDFVTLNTITSNTEQMVIENAGTGPALKVTQTGNNSVAEFYDKESGVALFVGNGGNVGIGTNNPQSALHVNGTFRCSGSVINASFISNTSSYSQTTVNTLTPSYSISITPKIIGSTLIITFSPYVYVYNNSEYTAHGEFYIYNGASILATSRLFFSSTVTGNNYQGPFSLSINYTTTNLNLITFDFKFKPIVIGNGGIMGIGATLTNTASIFEISP